MAYDISTGTDGVIRFRYDTDTLFDAVSGRTLFRAKNAQAAVEGANVVQDMTNRWAITQNELATFKKSLEKSLYDVFPEVVKLTVGVEDSPFFDATITPLEGGDALDGNWSGFSIVNNAAYNENNVTLVDKKLYNILVYLIMIDWYVMIGLDGEAQKIEALKIRELAALSDALFDLRKPLLQ